MQIINRRYGRNRIDGKDKGDIMKMDEYIPMFILRIIFGRVLYEKTSPQYFNDIHNDRQLVPCQCVCG